MTSIIILLMSMAITIGFIMLTMMAMNLGSLKMYNRALGTMITLCIILGLEAFAMVIILLR